MSNDTHTHAYETDQDITAHSDEPVSTLRPSTSLRHYTPFMKNLIRAEKDLIRAYYYALGAMRDVRMTGEDRQTLAIGFSYFYARNMSVGLGGAWFNYTANLKLFV